VPKFIFNNIAYDYRTNELPRSKQRGMKIPTSLRLGILLRC